MKRETIEPFARARLIYFEMCSLRAEILALQQELSAATEPATRGLLLARCALLEAAWDASVGPHCQAVRQGVAKVRAITPLRRRILL